MKRMLFTAATIVVFAITCQAQSQPQELPKFEVAAEFTTLEREAFDGRTEPGFGARFTYNLNKMFSLETAAYYFPRSCAFCRENGTLTEVVGGLKVGKRFEKWGIFAKGRPGVVSFSRGQFNLVPAAGPPSFPFTFETVRTNSFAVDAGGVLEFYPSKHIVTRFDAGDTIIHFNRSTQDIVQFISNLNTFELLHLNVPARTTHNFQFMASVGFRF